MLSTSFSSRFLTMLCLLSLVCVVPAAAQKFKYPRDTAVKELAPAAYVSPTNAPVASAVPPVVIPGTGNVTCATLDASDDPAFSHITGDWEFKIDPPNEGTYKLDGSTGGELVGGMPPNPNMSLEIDLLDANTLNSFQVLWNSTSNITYLVSAVIVKGGNEGTNVYPYPDLSSGDTGPFTNAGGGQAISHLAFCFEPFTGPTAAPASILGRVMNSYGRGVYGARVMLFDVSTGTAKYSITNTFGYYRFDDLPVGDLYELSVAHKRYKFSNSSLPFTLEADLMGMDFVAY